MSSLKKRKVLRSMNPVRRNVRTKKSSSDQKDQSQAPIAAEKIEEQNLTSIISQEARSSAISDQHQSEKFDFEGVQYSPYFLSPSDNPGSSLVSEVLDGSNYNTWSIAMSISLDVKNKLSFIDGSLPRPEESHSHYRIWSRCNSMVKSWLLNSVNKQIYGSILRLQDASDSHSIAEMVRREKISHRMKFLQNLVPNCDKVTGKALMLDEIINYVQSLQNQVEYLSMKLASISPVVYDFGSDLEDLLLRPEMESSEVGMSFTNTMPTTTFYPPQIQEDGKKFEDKSGFNNNNLYSFS